MNERFRTFLRWNIPTFAATLCVLIVFWDTINKIIIENVVEPLFKDVNNQSWLIQVCLLGLLVVIYYWAHKKIRQQYSTQPYQRLLIVVEFLTVYLIFRWSDIYTYYGVDYNTPSYLDFVVIVALLVELSFFIKELKCDNPNDKNARSIYQPFFIDQPTPNDTLNRKDHAKVLIEKIRSTYSSNESYSASNAFTILLSERFGQGKSSFFEQIKNECDSDEEVFVFRPWLSSDSNQMIVNFFDLLKEKIGHTNRKLRKLLYLYSKMATDHISGKVVNSLLLTAQYDSIETQHDNISKMLIDEHKLRIVLIDDVDRLQPEELLTLIKLIRNTADFPYMAYIIAADKEALKETLSSKSISNPELYLKKFFNFELLFPADDNNIKQILIKSVKEVLGNFINSSDIVEAFGLEFEKNCEMLKPVFQNPRDIKRFCNLLSYELNLLTTVDSCNKNNVQSTYLTEDINIIDFVELCIIQFISPEIYKLLRDYPDALLEIKKSRWVIRDNYVDYINDRPDVQHIQKVFKQSLKAMSIESDDSISNQTVSDSQIIESNSDLIEKAKPTEVIALKFLLDKLWSNNISKKDLRSVCFDCQYFIYFAGRYRKSEISTSEAISIFSSNNEMFQKTIKELYPQKRESVVHKLNVIIENNLIKQEIMLENIVSFMDIDYRNHCQIKGTIALELFEYYSDNTEFYYIINRLYNPPMDKPCTSSNLFDIHKTYFLSSKLYEICALYIHSMRPLPINDTYYRSCVFNTEQIDGFAQLIIDRFYNERFIKCPFQKDVLKSILSVRIAKRDYWNTKLINFIRQSKHPEEWLYRLFELTDDKTGLYWNHLMIKILCDDDKIIGDDDRSLFEIAEIFLGKDAASNYQEELSQIFPNKGTSPMPKLVQNSFVRSAFNWWNNHTNEHNN